MEIVIKPRQFGRFKELCLQAKDIIDDGKEVFIPCDDINDSIVERYKSTFIQIGMSISTLVFKPCYKQGRLKLHHVFDVDTNSIEPIYSIPYNEPRKFTGFTVSRINSQTT